MATLTENVAKTKENFRNIRDAINIGKSLAEKSPLTNEAVDTYATEVDSVINDAFNVGVEGGIEEGKTQQSIDFANSYQSGGERDVYYYAYAGAGWNDYTFEQALMYDIVPNSCNQIFFQSRVQDVAGIMKRKGVDFDFNTKEPTQCFSMFANSYVEYLPKLIMPTNSTAYGLCENCTKLKEIEGLVCNEKTAFQTTSGNNKSFQSCTAFEHCIFSGIIANDIDVHWSTLLDTESVVSLAVTVCDWFQLGAENAFTKTIVLSEEAKAIWESTVYPDPDLYAQDGASCMTVVTQRKGWNVE